MQLKDKVLHELLLSKGKYRSGGSLARDFGVSRTAVWKAIEQLKAEGCDIRAVTNRGYLLLQAPDLFSVSYLQELVSDCKTHWQALYYPELDSTNTQIKRLVRQGKADAGTIVIADRQTAGRGRLGKSFHSPEGGLYLSVLLEPTDLPVDDIMAITACTASAVYTALTGFGVDAQIKWVNDLFLNGRKICGILSEGTFNVELRAMEHLVIGIGINLTPDPHLPEELRPIVTDIETETGVRLRRCELTAAILHKLEHFIEGLPTHTYLPVYAAHSCTLGHQVKVQAERGTCQAKAVGFADDAGLIVEHPDGSRETIRSGTALIVD